MSYLNDAVTEITTSVQNGAFLHVAHTEYVDPSNAWDAHDPAELFYRQQNAYDGPVHVVAEEVDDGYHVMVMESNV